MTSINESVLHRQQIEISNPENIMNQTENSSAIEYIMQNKLTEELILERMNLISINPPWIQILTGFYLTLIIFGAAGNLLVVIVVARKSIMRTARNIFILNLAISGMAYMAQVTKPNDSVSIYC